MKINSDLLAKEVSKEELAQWLKQNEQAIGATNEFTEKNGLFADSYPTL